MGNLQTRIVCALGALLVSSACYAQTTNFTNPGIGDWNDAGNWDNGVPTATVAGTTAVINSGGTATLSLNSSTQNGFLGALGAGDPGGGSGTSGSILLAPVVSASRIFWPSADRVELHSAEAEP